MNKMLRFIHTYLISGFPFIIIGMIWNQAPHSNIFLKVLYELISYNFMLWFFILTVFLMLLLFMPTAREKTLHRIANINERDEREAYITGRAARMTYISSISLLIFLLFTSIFSVNIYKLSENKAINGKHHFASISLGFSLLDPPRMQENKERTIIFNSQTLSLSKPTMILLILFFQLVTFNFIARKELTNSLK